MKNDFEKGNVDKFNFGGQDLGKKRNRPKFTEISPILLIAAIDYSIAGEKYHNIESSIFRKLTISTMQHAIINPELGTLFKVQSRTLN